VYDSKWRIFSDWCQQQGLDPFSLQTSAIADFLNFLFTEKKFAATTIAGYRTAICQTLEKVSGSRPMGEHLLSSLISQSETERPRPSRSVPEWDLALVLNALHGSPFEPLDKAPLWALTFKMVFLTALATARQRSEVHAFSHRIQHTEDWSSITLIPDPLFIAKTEKAGLPHTRLQEVTLRALAPLVGSDLPTDTNNCVVRAIQIYLERLRAI